MNKRKTKKFKWKLHAIFCIGCGVTMGLMMQKTPKQLYFYCHQCYARMLRERKDLEKIYNQANNRWMSD